MPELTVVMPVYNGERYLKDAIESILNQTYKNFELIIINDGSTDNSLNVISTYKDNRIKLIDNRVNRGIPYSRNMGLKIAKGQFLTWCDCDDVCMRERFSEQVEFLKNNPAIGACGTWMRRFGDRSNHKIKSLKNPEILKATLLFKPSMLNASVMLRLEQVRKHQLLYNEAFPIAEDYDFILRCSELFPITNIPRVLYKYRASDTSIMDKYKNLDKDSDEIHFSIYKFALSKINITPSKQELIIHRLISSDKLFSSFSQYKQCYRWLAYLKERNKISNSYDKRVFNKVLAQQFYFISKKAALFGRATLFFYLHKSISNFGFVSMIDIAKLAVKCALKHHKF